MVAKISVGNSLFGALSYNQMKVDNEEGKVLLSSRMIENRDGVLDMQSCLHSFNLYLSNNIKTEKPVVHISLNPHPDDKLTDEQLTDIAQEYMDRMGFGEQPYIVYKHSDIEREHIHIVTLNVDRTGKKIDDSNNFYRSKKITRDIEDKYDLHKAERKKKEQQAFSFKKIDAQKGNLKIQIGNVIKPLAATYHFQSFNEYRTLLSHYNICVEESKGVRNGKPYKGFIYYATNDNGEKVSNPFKSSLYGRSVGYNSIYEKIERHKKTIKDKKLNRQTAGKLRMVKDLNLNRDGFMRELAKENIDVIFRENSDGRIYGATFIDHNNHCIFNGSRLGREFTANSFMDYFAGVQAQPQVQQEPQAEEREQLYQEEHSSSLGGMFDLPTANGDDPEENAFRKRMQRKKRKGHKF